MEAKYVWEGLTFTGIEYKGQKKTFVVDKVIPLDGSPAPLLNTEEDAVPVYRMSELTRVKIARGLQMVPASANGAPVPEFEGLAIEDDGFEDIDEPDIEIPKTPKTQRAPETPKKSSKKEKKKAAKPAPPTVTFDSIGGLAPQIDAFRTFLVSILEDAEEFSKKGLIPPRGVLLYGPPGTGKTLMLRAVAAEMNAKPFILDGSVMGKYMGESEASIRKIFAEARKHQPSIIFMDEVDSLAPKRSQGEGSEGRVVATLLTEIDNIDSVGEDGLPTRVAIVAATNRPNAIDEALRRAGRFEKELEIGIPDASARHEILTLLTRKIEFSPCTDKESYLATLASRTHGYVGADLESVIRGAFTLALNRRRRDTAETTLISSADLETALTNVKPTAMREIFIEPPKVRWSDIGGQEEVKQRLREAVEWPLTHPEVFKRLGGTPRKGLLLYGPPGCSKTLTAKALATEAGLNFMAVKGPELFSMYVGESERAVREVFRKARAASPSIIFFDEIDALSASREGGGKGAGANILTSLLNEMDGIETLKNVIVLAATNRPEIIDPALMRPGRLDTILYVGPPDLEARKQILGIKMRKMAVGEDVDVEELAEGLKGFSGAEIVNVCDEAIHYAMRESFEVECVGRRHFDMALEKAIPQITEEMCRKYEEWSVGGVKKI